MRFTKKIFCLYFTIALKQSQPQIIHHVNDLWLNLDWSVNALYLWYSSSPITSFEFTPLSLRSVLEYFLFHKWLLLACNATGNYKFVQKIVIWKIFSLSYSIKRTEQIFSVSISFYTNKIHHVCKKMYSNARYEWKKWIYVSPLPANIYNKNCISVWCNFCNIMFNWSKLLFQLMKFPFKLEFLIM